MEYISSCFFNPSRFCSEPQLMQQTFVTGTLSYFECQVLDKMRSDSIYLFIHRLLEMQKLCVMTTQVDLGNTWISNLILR